jgi:HSP20 family protein
MNTVSENKKVQNATPTPSVERPFVAPDVNIYETPDQYVLQAEMPGVTREGLEVIVEGNTLTFVGRRNEEQIPGNVLYRESRTLNFRRVFELDPAIDTEKVSASMEQGILTLTLPKSSRVKPRRIEVR